MLAITLSGIAHNGRSLQSTGIFGRFGSASSVTANPCRSSLAVTKRAPMSSPLRHTSEQTRMTSPPAVKARANSSGTASEPTSRQAPRSEISRISHSIHGASGAGIRKPGLYSSTRTCLRLPRSSRCLAMVSPRAGRLGPASRLPHPGGEGRLQDQLRDRPAL